MADDNILRVGAEFDVTPIIAGTQAAGAAFENMGAKIAATSEVVEATLSPIATATAFLKAQGLSATEVSAALAEFKSEENAAAEAAGLLANEADIATPAVTRLGTAARTAGTGLGAFGKNANEARVVVGGMTGSVGMMESGLARLAGQTGILAPLFADLFPLVAAVGFVAIVEQVADAIVKATDDLVGWTEIAKKAFSEDEAANFKQIQTNIELADARERLNAVGLEGEKKRAADAEATSDEIKRQTDAVREQSRSVLELTQKSNELHSELRAIQEGDLAGHFGDWLRGAAFVADVTEVDRQLALAQKHAEELAAELPKLQVKQSGAKLEDIAESTKETLDSERAKAEASKTAREAVVAFDEDMTKRLYEEHHTTLEAEVADLLTQENRKYQILVDSFNAQQAVLAQRGKTGENVGPELATLQGQREAAETNHQKALYDIDAAGEQQRLKLDQEYALQTIAMDKQIAEAQDELAAHKAELAFSGAEDPAALQLAAAEYTRATTSAIEDQIIAIQKENVELAKDPSPESAAKVRQNETEITTLRIQEETKRLDIVEETTRRMQQFQSQQLSNELASMNEQIRVADEGERRISENLDTQFEERKISGSKYVEEVTANAAKEYSVVSETVRREIAEIALLARVRMITEEDETKRLEALWKQQEQAYQKMLDQEVKAAEQANKKETQDFEKTYRQIQNEMNSALLQYIEGHKKLGQALEEVWNHLAETAINDILSIAENFALGLVFQQAAQEKSVIMSAKDAAAKAWANAPNPIIGAIAAASTFAGIIALYTPSFEKGGVMPYTGLAHLHEGEGVLTAKQMTAINNSSVSSTGGARTVNSSVHQENHFHKTADMSDRAIARMTRTAARKGLLSLRDL